MSGIEATYTRDPDGPDRWLAGGRFAGGLGPDYERRAAKEATLPEQLAEARSRLVADLRSNSEGALTKLRLALAPPWRDAVRSLDPEAAGERILQAARRVILAEMPRHQGALMLTKDTLHDTPIVEVVLSPRLRDGGTATLLGRSELARLEANWAHATRVALGLTRDLLPSRRVSALLQHELREGMDRATRRFMEVLDARMRGEVGQEELRLAARDAEAAATAYRAAHSSAPAQLDPSAPAASERQRNDQRDTLALETHHAAAEREAVDATTRREKTEAGGLVQFEWRLERGLEYLSRVPEDFRHGVIRDAVHRAFPVAATDERAAIAVLPDRRALRVRVAISQASGWTQEQLQKPIFQYRFAREIHRAFLEHGDARDATELLARPTRLGRVGRAIGRATRTTVDGLQAAQAPGRTLAESAFFSRLPSPLRALRSLSHALGFLGRQED